METRSEDTIAAIATPVGVGAIAVVRVSGQDSIEIVDRVFVGKELLVHSKGYSVHYGRLINRRSEPVDQVLVTVFREPHSYTGENSVEISCHGGLLVSRLVFETVIQAGARYAEPGEFTKRAFLNGRIDLSQAEAVADVVAAQSERALSASLHQLQGRLGRGINVLRSELVNLLALIELELDFSEEGIQLCSRPVCLTKLDEVRASILKMARSFEVGRLYREGISVAIVGKPNAGKSSLFNSLLGENRAIVTDIPGTTRDSLEENIRLSGLLFRISDTAGLRDSEDPIEAEGVNRTKRLAESSDLRILVIDASNDNGIHHGSEVRDSTAVVPPSSSTIVVLNKIDLLVNRASSLAKLGQSRVESDHKVVPLSAITGEGMEDLRKAMVESVFGDSQPQPANEQITSRRHQEALCRAAEALSSARVSLESGLSGEFVALDIRQSMEALSEITGAITADDVLNSIFQSFCIGK